MIDAYVACGGQADKGGCVKRETMIKIIKHDFGLTIDIEDLINHNQIKDMFEKRFEELQKEFSMFEKIKKFTLLPKEFSIEAGEITATLKLKRKVIHKKYKELIEKMYSE